MSWAGLLVCGVLMQADPTVDPAVDPSAVQLQRLGLEGATGRAAAVRVSGGALLHTGQIFPAGPASTPTSPTDQVLQAFLQLRDVLQADGAELGQMAKLNVYVSHSSVTPLVEQALQTWVAKDHPVAVSFVQTRLNPPGTMVALDAVAVLTPPEKNMARATTVTRRAAPQPGSPAISAVLPEGGVIYISGQAEKAEGTVATATTATMQSLLKTLEFLGRSTADVVQVKAFLVPMEEAPAATTAIKAAFGKEVCPPISYVEWESSLPIEIELVVASPLPPKDAEPVPVIEYLTPPGMTASPVYCRVARVNSPARLYTAGLYGSQEHPNSPDEVREVFTQLRRIVELGGSDLLHLAKGTYYVSDVDVSRVFNEVRPGYYNPERPPAASKAQVFGTGRAGRTLTIDMIAVPKP